MKLSHLLRNILSIFFMLSIVAANNQQGITILGKNNVVLGKADVLKQNQYYLSVNDLGKIIGSGSFVNEKTEKIVIYIDSFKIKLSHNIPFILVGEKIYQMENSVIKKNSIKQFSYEIKIADFYYKDTAKIMIDRIINETQIKNPKIKKITKEKYRVYLGPFDKIASLQKSFNDINVLEFENIEIIKND